MGKLASHYKFKQSVILRVFFPTLGMTPLHCAAISHSATMKALSSSGGLDVSLQNKAEEKLYCVQMLLNAGASLLSPVLHGSRSHP